MNRIAQILGGQKVPDQQAGKAERQEEIKPGEQDTKTAQELKAVLENQ